MRYIVIALFLFNLAGFAQSDKRYNSWSVELEAGMHAPIAPTKFIKRSNFIALRQFQLSGRYMFDQTWGIKGHYSFNGFRDKKQRDMTLLYHRLGIEGVVNLSNLIDIDYPLREDFGLLFHAGVGVTFANPYSVKGIDHLGHIIVGLTPQVKLNENFSLFGDLSFITNFRQHYSYSGQQLNFPHGKGETGSFMNVSLGVIMNIGNKKYHADWY